MTLLTFISPEIAGSATFAGLCGFLGLLVAVHCAVQAFRSRSLQRREWFLTALVVAVLSSGLVTVAALGGVNAIFGLTPEQLSYLS